MALIKKKEQVVRVKKNVGIEEAVLKELELYCKFIGLKPDTEGLSYIINEGLKHLFSKDKDFTAFKKNEDSLKKQNADIVADEGKDEEIDLSKKEE